MTETSRPEPYVEAPVASGRASIVFAGIVVLLGLVGQVISQLLPYLMQSFELATGQIVWIFLPVQLATLIAAVLAIVLAIRPLMGAGPKALAGAGAGIGVASLISTVVGFALPFVLQSVV